MNQKPEQIELEPDETWRREECRVTLCERYVHARGLCMKHYKRWERTGNTGKRKVAYCTNCDHPVIIDIPDGRWFR